MNKLSLHIPTYEELCYRQKIMSQPATMYYNKGYALNFEGYHRETGCIDFPEKAWEGFYKYWINNNLKCYYAYIVRNSDNQFIGEVNFHYNDKQEWYEMGIVIEDKYRGMGYSEDALNLMLFVAFHEYKANSVHNDFEKSRTSAIRTHLAVGFKQIKEENGFVDLLIQKEEFENR